MQTTRKRIWPTVLLALAALLFISAGLMPAATLLDCEFTCNSPGASNQSACAPVAGAMHVAVDHTNTATLEYDAWNGTIWRTLIVGFDDLTVHVHQVNVYSNSGILTLYLGSHAGMSWMEAVVDGIGGEGLLTTFTANCLGGGCGGSTPTPEPGTGEMGLLLGGLAAGLGVVRRLRRRPASGGDTLASVPAPEHTPAEDDWLHLRRGVATARHRAEQERRWYGRFGCVPGEA